MNRESTIWVSHAQAIVLWILDFRSHQVMLKHLKQLKYSDSVTVKIKRRNDGADIILTVDYLMNGVNPDRKQRVYVVNRDVLIGTNNS